MTNVKTYLNYNIVIEGSIDNEDKEYIKDRIENSLSEEYNLKDCFLLSSEEEIDHPFPVNSKIVLISDKYGSYKKGTVGVVRGIFINGSIMVRMNSYTPYWGKNDYSVDENIEFLNSIFVKIVED